MSKNIKSFILLMITLNFLQHHREAKILRSIFKKVLKNPNNEKYQNLNLNRIPKQLAQCQICMNLLYDAGFYKSTDGKRLLYHITKLNQLKTIDKILSLKLIDLYSSKSNPMTCTLQQNVQDKHCKLQDCLHLEIIGNILHLYEAYIMDNQTMYDGNESDENNIQNYIFSKME
eukprot:277275_1